MSLVCLTYVSLASRPITDDDLMNILNVARDNNSQLDITGMLLYRDGYFIQALEGERDIVKSLFKKIAQDDRHQNVLMIFEDEIEERTYDNWSMGFKKIAGDLPNELEGYSDFLDNPPLMQNEPARARLLMDTFRSGIYY